MLSIDDYIIHMEYFIQFFLNKTSNHVYWEDYRGVYFKINYNSSIFPEKYRIKIKIFDNIQNLLFGFCVFFFLMALFVRLMPWRVFCNDCNT